MKQKPEKFNADFLLQFLSGKLEDEETVFAQGQQNEIIRQLCEYESFRSFLRNSFFIEIYPNENIRVKEKWVKGNEIIRQKLSPFEMREYWRFWEIVYGMDWWKYLHSLGV